MEFPSPLIQAVFLKRYKRFLAEVLVNNHENRVIYCPNMGAMTGCDILGSRIWFSHSSNPRRKFPDTWELVEVDAGYLVSINNAYASQLIMEAIANATITELQGYSHAALNGAEGDEDTFDIMLEKKMLSEEMQNERCDIQVESVTLGDEIHRGFFPDAMTEKGVSKLKALIHAKDRGHRAVLLYCVQHTGINRLFPADHIDSTYGSLLRQAVIKGVEVYAYRLEISLREQHISTPVEVCIPARMICSSRY